MHNRLSLILAVALLMSLSFSAGQNFSLHPMPVSAASLTAAPLVRVDKPADAPQAIGGQTLPVTSGLFYKTYSGMDFHSLDTAVMPQFVTGTGGGAFPAYKAVANDSAIHDYFELRLDLPQGAQVKEVTFLYRNCGGSAAANDFYFGAYTPETAGFVYFLPETRGARSVHCTQTQTLARSIAPAPTIDNAQHRYILGWNYGVMAGPDFTVFEQVLIGARVGYSLPTAYLPLALKSGASSW